MAIGKTNCAGRHFPNGTEWTETNVGPALHYFPHHVLHCDGVWSVGKFYSLDGKTWQEAEMSEGVYWDSDLTRDYAYGNGVIAYPAKKYDTNEKGIIYSTDCGKTWAYRKTVDSTYELNCICYGNGIWLYGRQGIWKSTNPITGSWSKVSELQIGTITFANGVFIASTKSGLYYSNNGDSWYQSSLHVMCIRVCYAKGIWVACASGAQGEGIYYSEDNGATWAASNITTGAFNVLRTANGIFVASNTSGGIISSTDGKTWSRSNVDEDCVFWFGGGRWIAYRRLYNSNVVYYSKDATTWEQSEEPLLGFILPDDITFANGIWVAVRFGAIYYSVAWEDD